MPRKKEVKESNKIWISFRFGTEKFYGQVEDCDFTSIGKASVRIFNPVSGYELDGTRRFKSCLDRNECDSNFQYYNTSIWTAWQKVNEVVTLQLNAIVVQLEERLKEALKAQVETKPVETQSVPENPTPQV